MAQIYHKQLFAFRKDEHKIQNWNLKALFQQYLSNGPKSLTMAGSNKRLQIEQFAADKI